MLHLMFLICSHINSVIQVLSVITCRSSHHLGRDMICSEWYFEFCYKHQFVSSQNFSPCSMNTDLCTFQWGKSWNFGIDWWNCESWRTKNRTSWFWAPEVTWQRGLWQSEPFMHYIHCYELISTLFFFLQLLLNYCSTGVFSKEDLQQKCRSDICHESAEESKSLCSVWVDYCLTPECVDYNHNDFHLYYSQATIVRNAKDTAHTKAERNILECVRVGGISLSKCQSKFLFSQHCSYV